MKSYGLCFDTWGISEEKCKVFEGLVLKTLHFVLKFPL